MRHFRLLVAVLAISSLAALTPSPASAQNLAAFEKHVTEKRLDNGLTVLIYERPTAPVVSFFTLVNVGAAQEVPGITGIAHMFEHMAFKGTSTIGTNDYPAESKALAKVDDAYHAYDRERRRRGGPDPAKLQELEQAWKKAQEEADRYVVPNQFDDIVERAGGVGLNAFTNSDETGFFFSLPANKVELWTYLESNRFLDPVFREFYKERDVVMEERRLRTESQPFGRLIEQGLAVAFTAHPYRQPVVGYMSDLQAFSREDAEAFYRKYYVPANMVTAIVGDVKAEEVVPLVAKYFGRLPERPRPEPLRTVEPVQNAERIVEMPDRAQPIYMEAYHKPAVTDPDEAVYDVINDVLSRGPTSRLYRSLVRDRKIAARVFSFSGFPGNKYPNLYVAFALPAPGHDDDDVRDAIRAELERLCKEPVSPEELARAKTRAKAGLIRGLQSNQGIASQLATYQTLYGDWRELFRHVERIEKVTADDILRVAGATFVPANRTVAMIVSQQALSGSNREQENGR
jgi:predicted Zn-dependent peptidase